jgi:hypothetical protein
MYGQDANTALDPAASIAQEQPSLATIEAWKATAKSSDYIAPKAPI